MDWLQLEIAPGVLDAERVAEALAEAGALSVTFTDAADQPIFEPDPGQVTLWSATRVTGLFHADTDWEAVRIRLRTALQMEELPPHYFTPLAEREWVHEWLKDFTPMRFGRRLWICPTTYKPPDSGAINILLNPGLAFGTGTHPTTAMCLEWLDGEALAGRDVIDYGCGSGILAIAAARLGAHHVWGVDHDPQALTATRDNARANGVLADIDTCLPGQLPPLQVDALLANILAKPLMELAPRFAGLLKPGGVLLLSGILDTQENQVRAAYTPWFRFTVATRRGEWLSLGAHLMEHT
ncbi:MAG: 50S ribosomal protein L11 methyltransferase [Gammaproteobacteria bacterium]|nr:50S ribosomal protein L11 methyltransferase [Gammaproteobacteria bacterium]